MIRYSAMIAAIRSLQLLAENSRAALHECASMKKRANTGLGLAIIAGVLSSVIAVSAQETSPTPQTTGQPVVTAVEVIVTGSNIPTSEEVGPNPVDTYRREDITRLGVRSATDFVQKLPVATGAAINENLTMAATDERKLTCAVFYPKKPWCCKMDVVSRQWALPVIRSTSTCF